MIDCLLRDLIAAFADLCYAFLVWKSVLFIQGICRMNFRTFDLNLLKVLDALLREGSTVGAARRLGLSQSAVSAALSRLRAAIGDDLFVRRGGRLEPTDFARSLSGTLKSALRDLEGLLKTDVFDPATSDAVIRISGPDYYSDMILPRLAAILQDKARNMRLQMFDLVPDDHFATLDRYEVDLVLMPEGSLPDWAMSRTIFRSEFALLARRGHPSVECVNGRATISMDAFCKSDHVLYSPSGATRSFTDEALERLGRRRRVAMTLPKFSAVAHTVSRTDMLGTLPRTLADELAPALDLLVMSSPVQLAPHPMLMVWSGRSHHNLAHRWVRDQIVELVRPFDAP